jgi:hypothetical protein
MLCTLQTLQILPLLAALAACSPRDLMERVGVPALDRAAVVAA